ncbi:hypothetical protein BZA77DRAFT_352157 [Pyronema omphalodes]|nr:hypothetical protein BZA77DRAFT_359351 [Pyronema omphalodes]KAI5817969.1 hypothetical protein BZA77DRAFT_352157 [Pyronema omphalodes]
MVRNRTSRAKAASKLLAPLEDQRKDEQTTESHTFTAANEQTTHQKSPEPRPTIKAVRKKRITSAQRQCWIRRERWIFMGVPPRMKNETRTAMHKIILQKISDMDVVGIKRVHLIGNFYLAIRFISPKLRNRALVKIKDEAFNFENAPMPVAIRAFEDTKDLPHYVWRITGPVSADLDDIQNAVEAFCKERYPLFSSAFQVSRKVHLGRRTDQYFVRFDRAPPCMGMKVISIGKYLATINEDLFDLCGLCNRVGHSVFYCRIKSDNRLSKHICTGSVGELDDMRDSDSW